MKAECNVSQQRQVPGLALGFRWYRNTTLSPSLSKIT